ncbi:Pls/PosA family non-ribosomal peptide synthetase [Halomonas sp. HP20-15]|uniref:Pls/PosA family non-ribosomal peptide synthetase n=1 Tax=Halomonas sp. HP20-15 TaxID=3085901 RepID=UPI002981AF2C|nr:Pls/PosA family non-ribosomal peptide synthetase [Halomonas sp. HP20-15]MDW5375788.1 Pls/PosA family non-ribosomal peptide synthetase [Halomonas sp. HP20-15]
MDDALVQGPILEHGIEILTCHGDTAPRWQPGERLHHLFETMADRCPAATAVETPHCRLSFAALDGEANRLARLLEDHDIGAGDVVALLFDRDADAYIALLAVLKLHAAYVPLDPKFPGERIRYIAADAGVSLVLTVSEHAALAEASAQPVLSLDQMADLRRGYSSERLTLRESSSELAYIIYTSGSTGRPKGVPIEHGAIVNFARVAAATYGYQPGDRVYQGLTLAFDFSVEEIWVPLLAGATLVPSQSKGSLVGEELYEFLKASRISALCCVPTLLASLEEGLSDLPDLRLLIVSGEACPEDIVRRWHRPGRMILNAYGPTETTVTATIAELAPDQPVTIGKPLPSYSVVILDRDAPRALPFGEIGEIGIAGIGLSPGYLGRDDLTHKAFIPDFLGLPHNPSGRIYRTGDLGRIDEAGRVEYLGRLDTQVKIRGYRIEVTEIESALMEQPGIQQAVVDTYEATPGHVELVAYYTLAPPMTVEPGTLAESLRERLPAYMVPAYYEPLERIAMLPSDKADRSRLPPPSSQRLVRGCSDFAAAEGDIETRLAAMLAELLSLERVSATHHFFDDLGANSLLMARFSTRIRREFATNDIAMREIYLAPTIRQLAGKLGSHSNLDTPPPRHEPTHVATNLAYWSTGAYQLLASLLVTWGFFVLWKEGLLWCLEVQDMALIQRALSFTALVLALSVVLPIVAKWLLVGRWRAETFPVWGMTYTRFWTVKTLIRLSPLALVPGTPLYTAYLKLLGARVAWSALVQCPLPVCTDLVEIGPQAVIGRGVTLQGYKALGGRIVTGPVRVATRAYVGEGAVLDIDTRLEEGAELAHASALHQGQVAKAGLGYHGSPAEATAPHFRSLPPGEASWLRQLAFSLAQVIGWVGGLTVSMIVLVTLIGLTTLHDGSGQASGTGIHLPTDTLTALPYLLVYCAVVFVGSLLLGLATVLVVPRLAWLFLHEERIYPLYGVRHWLLQTIVRTSNSEFFNLLFGDSSYIVHYLRAIGYRFHGLQQSGSNFGVQQRHDVPFLCEFGLGTMVSDGLVMANAEFSNAAFRLGRVSFGRDNFLGNEIFYPTNGKTGDNVLLGTKTMVPVTGAPHEDIGLLGSPTFEIPRSVARDRCFDQYKDPDLLRERLRLKNRVNLASMALFLGARFGLLVLMTVLVHALVFEAGLDTVEELAVASLLLTLVSTLYVIVIERAVCGFGHLEPRYCSIYDHYFWIHERYWKLLVSSHLTMFNGTPFKGLLWRLLALRVGRKLYDEGCGIPERSLVAIGDHCTLNAATTIQAHSLEDGAFKSDHVVLGHGVTLEPRAFVHYGTYIDDQTLVEIDAFLMKGERTAPYSHWRGNPARPVTGAAPVEDMPIQISGGLSVCART